MNYGTFNTTEHEVVIKKKKRGRSPWTAMKQFPRHIAKWEEQSTEEYV